MRIVLSLLFFISAILGSSAQAPVKTDVPTDTSKHAMITFDTEVVNYGSIQKGSDGTREFKFKNTGNAPLVIYNVNSSCGCLVPSWPKDPIQPGGTGVIKAKYDTQRIGPFEKTLTVYSNTKEVYRILKIKGIVLMQNKEDEKPVNNAPVPIIKNPHE